MSLPILEQNSYLSLVIKDNHIFANLAYTDFNTDRSYILTDLTDLSPLKFRMDDIVFSRSFWFEYFSSLEKVFGWDIVQESWVEDFKFLPFESEGTGLSGIKILLDDNQPFFKNIYSSLNDFSNDIALRVVDKSYMKELLQGLSSRLEYDNILWLDLDISHFSAFTYSKEKVSGGGIFSKRTSVNDLFGSSSIDWNNEIGLIDSLNSSKLKAFVSADVSSEEMIDKWANFIAHSVDSLSNPLLEDLLRAFTTVQNLTIKANEKLNMEGFGKSRSLIICSGKVARILPTKYLLLSLIDGFELEGEIDMYIDTQEKILSYGKNFIEGSTNQDIYILKKDILEDATKILIPEIRTHKAKNKVILSASITSQDFNRKDIYSINPNLEIFKLPYISNNVVVECELKNNSYINDKTKLEFVSSTGGVVYRSLVVDSRFRPIIYGPKVGDNRNKLQMWLNGDKK